MVDGNKKEKSASIEVQLLADFRGVRDEIRTHTAQRPLPPQSSVSTNSTTRTFGQVALNLSEKRDSNPRPQPWQGCALPTELFSRVECLFDLDLRYFLMFSLSEKRDSNPRPQPWQGCALPTELFSRWATCFFAIAMQR